MVELPRKGSQQREKLHKALYSRQKSKIYNPPSRNTQSIKLFDHRNYRNAIKRLKKISINIWFQTKCFNQKLRSHESGKNKRRLITNHSVKSVRIWSFSGPYFPTVWLNTERYGASFRIQSECGKIRTSKTPKTDTFRAMNTSVSSQFTYCPLIQILHNRELSHRVRK